MSTDARQNFGKLPRTKAGTGTVPAGGCLLPPCSPRGQQAACHPAMRPAARDPSLTVPGSWPCEVSIGGHPIALPGATCKTSWDSAMPAGTEIQDWRGYALCRSPVSRVLVRCGSAGGALALWSRSCV
eukprot:6083918-Amphidinium_carterae.1